MKTNSIILFVCCALSAALTPQSPAQNAAALPVRPFLDEWTVMVARVDLAAVDTAATATFLEHLAAPAAESEFLRHEIAAVRRVVDQWLAAFREAGGRELFALFSLSDFGRRLPVALVVPMPEGADAERLEAMLTPIAKAWKADTAVLHSSLVVALEPVLSRFSALQPVPLPDLDAAFAEAAGGFVQVAILPYPDFSRVVQEVMPTLPSFMAGGPSAPLGQGLRWLSASLAGQPEFSLRLTEQLRTNRDADALRNATLALFDFLEAIPEVRKLNWNWAELREMLTPRVQDDRLIVRLNQTQLTTLAAKVILPTLEAAKQKAQFVSSINNLKQIGLAARIYANEHKDAFPPNLAAVLPHLGSAAILIRPGASVRPPEDFMQWEPDRQAEWIDQHSSYVFLPTTKTVNEIKNSGSWPLAYERLDRANPGPVPVLFADGHVEAMRLDAFKELIAPFQQP